MTDPANYLVDLTPFLTTTLGLAIALAIWWWAVEGIDWAPILVIASVPLQRSMLVGFGDRSMTLTQTWLLAFFAGALLCFARGQIRIRLDVVSSLFGLLACSIAFSVVAYPPLRLWAAETYRWVVAAIFFTAARSYFGRSSVHRAALTLGTMMIACCGVAMWQIIAADGPTSFERNGLMRVAGGFGEPNPFAAFLVFASLCLMGLVWTEKGAAHGAFLAGGAAAGVLATVLTQSRGGLIGLAAGIGVLSVAALHLLSPGTRKVVVSAAGVLGALTIIAICVLAPWEIRSQAVSSANWAEREREAHWGAAWHMFRLHSWFGLGAGGFNDSFRVYTTDWHFRIPRGHAHNAYLQMAAEAGIAALLLYILLFATLGRRLIQRSVETGWTGIAIGTLAATLGLAVHGVFDYLHVLSLGLLFSGMWACALGVRDKDRQLRERNRAY
jgi:O-antigen ligase